MLSIRCTHCSKHFVAEYTRISASQTDIEYVRCYPSRTATPVDKRLAELSPRAAEIHIQAQTADINGLPDIAAMGYRTALELMIKDYAIKIIGKTEDEVKNKKLATAIKEYLGQTDLLKAADVVRLLGNDYTHFKKEFPQHDIETLKDYYDIFLSLVLQLLKVKKPPVAR